MENILNTEKDEEVVINNTFRDYYYDVLTPKVVLFNTLVGGDFKTLSEEDKASRIDLQIDIVSEELIKEYAVFFAKDQIEELDAIADVLFTVSYLQYQLKVCDEQGLNNLDINHDRLQFLMSQIGLFFESMYTHFDLDIIIKATDLVVENNMLKFTTDKEDCAARKVIAILLEVVPFVPLDTVVLPAACVPAQLVNDAAISTRAYAPPVTSVPAVLSVGDLS